MQRRIFLKILGTSGAFLALESLTELKLDKPVGKQEVAKYNKNEVSKAIEALKSTNIKFPSDESRLDYDPNLDCWVLIEGGGMVAWLGAGFIEGCFDERK